MGNKFKPEHKLKFCYYRVVSFLYYLAELVVTPKVVDYKKVPIIINNFNRLDMLEKLIKSLEIRGYTNIFIIDNLSTYPPLLQYYKNCPYKVFYLTENIGLTSLWKTGIYKQFRKSYFVYTDPDVVLVDECPDDFMKVFFDGMKKHKLARKIGFSLKIDDLPDHYELKERVITWEQRFFDEKIRDGNLFWAPIDTTFALYRPFGKRKHANGHIEMYRTGYPYMVRHLPWYIDSTNPDDENRYYIEQSSMKTTYWTNEGKQILNRKK